MNSQLALLFHTPQRRTPRSACRVTFYQTTPMTTEQLADAIVSAQAQDEQVHALFRTLRRPLTSREVLAAMREFGVVLELTSVHRALSNLTDAKALVKGDCVLGVRGRPVHRWVLA